MLNLGDKDEIENFDNDLNKYGASSTGFFPNHISLTRTLDWLKIRYPTDCLKIFAAVLDLKINFTYLHVDSGVSGGHGNNINRVFALKRNEGKELLFSESVDTLIKIHHADTAFCLRYRAIWDKLMGLCFLMFAPDLYEGYSKARSKLTFFTKHLANDSRVKDLMNSDFTGDSLEFFLTSFENSFRTPEIHGTGRLRKFAFNINPEERLVLDHNYWNALNEVVSKLGGLFENI